jgi:hypothetical protein
MGQAKRAIRGRESEMTGDRGEGWKYSKSADSVRETVRSLVGESALHSTIWSPPRLLLRDI